jgi:hypothetical protein
MPPGGGQPAAAHSRRADRLCGGQTVSDASGKPINVDLESIVLHVEV